MDENDNFLNEITDGTVINKSSWPTEKVKIQAEEASNGATESVELQFDTNPIRTENTPPYDFLDPTDIEVGEYTLAATPYSEDDANGVAGSTLVATFTVRDNGPFVPQVRRRVS